MRSSWLLVALVLSLATAFLQNAALADFWYWRYPWFDLPMHYLGGLAVSALLIAFLERHKPRAFMLLFALVIIGWEVFEYVFGIPREENYALDTVLDLIIGSLGALTMYIAARFSLWR